MSVFSYEWKKLMLYQRGLLYILAALLVSTVWLAAADRPQNGAMEEYREEYEWYLERLDGEIGRASCRERVLRLV